VWIYSVSTNSATKCELEALQYLEDSGKDLVMLNSYPTVKQLFLRFNATLPPSAPVERLFSFAGIIANVRQTRMTLNIGYSRDIQKSYTKEKRIIQSNG